MEKTLLSWIVIKVAWLELASLCTAVLNAAARRKEEVTNHLCLDLHFCLVSQRPSPLHPLFSVLALVLYLESKNADTRSLCTWQGLDTTGYMHFLTLPGLPLLGVLWGEMCLYLFYVVVLIDSNTEVRASLPRNAVWDYFTLLYTKKCEQK